MEWIKIFGNPQIKSIKTQASNFGPVRRDTPVIWDWGSHELSILISLVGSKPQKIKIKRTMNIKNEKGDISAWEIKCKFKGGITTTSSISNNLPKVREICLEGNDGIIILDEFNKPYLEHYKSIRDKENLDKEACLIYIENNNEPLITYSNSKSLYKFIKYKPNVNIKTGISEFIKWYRNN